MSAMSERHLDTYGTRGQEPEPGPDDMPSLADLQAADAYALLHDGDVAAMTADSPWYAGGRYYRDAEDAAIVRQRLAERAARDAARFARDAERLRAREQATRPAAA